ncbi:MAG: NAD-dependent epimerase/dehydratase family protein [Porticoccaceae bacterium]
MAVKRVLVTGARGFLGRACADILARAGWDVVGLSATATNRIAAQSSVDWRQLDLMDTVAIRDLIHDVKPTHLLHAAWRPVHGDVVYSPENLDWLQASISLVKTFRETGGERVAVIGSSAEYDWNEGRCRNGITPMRPQTIYGSCKHALQIVLSAYAKVTGLGFVWPRVFFVYGPGEHESRLVTSVIGKLMRGDKALCTHGLQVRDYLHVEDVAAGIVAALTSSHQGPIDIASGKGVAVRDLVLEIARQMDREDLVCLGALPSPKHDVPLVLGDAGEAQALLGWKAKFKLEQGIADTIAQARTAFAQSLTGLCAACFLVGASFARIHDTFAFKLMGA